MKTGLLAVCLALAALPLVAHERKFIPVLVDSAANRAYIPEGTVLPAQMNFRFEKFRLNETEIGQLRADRDAGKGNVRSVRADRAATARLKAKAPLVVEYAPAERFVQIRKNYEAQARRRSPVQSDSSHQSCYDIYVQDTATGVYGTYYGGFTSTFCAPSGSTPVGYAHDWEFRAAGDYSDDDQWINPYVYIQDDNGNYNCFDEYYYSGDTGQCSASATTVLLQSGCLNDVDTGAVLYVIEYLNNYQENYLGFTFLVDYCTYFY